MKCGELNLIFHKPVILCHPIRTKNDPKVLYNLCHWESDRKIDKAYLAIRFLFNKVEMQEKLSATKVSIVHICLNSLIFKTNA